MRVILKLSVVLFITTLIAITATFLLAIALDLSRSQIGALGMILGVMSGVITFILVPYKGERSDKASN